MKYRPVISIFFFTLTLLAAVASVAQDRVSIIRTLDIDIWPDYDRPSVLVLLTGRLPDNTELPASVTLPLPESARLNAVARIDSKDGHMKDDIFSTTDPPGMLTFITPDHRFRVEYYFPYSASEDKRSFDYTWLAPIGVNIFRLRVQQPASARSFKTEPNIDTVTRGDDGFKYHSLPTQVVEAWQPVSIKVNYTMADATLSKKSVPVSNTNTQPVVSTPSPGNGSNMMRVMILMVLGGLVVLGVLIWQFALRRSSHNGRQPVDSSVQKRARAKFCHNCGEPRAESDKYCRECGHRL